MPKVEVEWDSYLPQTCRALSSGGVLLTSVDANGKANPMTIGWAAFGVFWGYPVATVMVRPSRYTFGCIEVTGDFTVSVPYPDLADQVVYCGTTSGRDVDKFRECGFSPVSIEAIRSPGVAQCGVIYFCEVVHFNDVLPEHLEADIARACYPSGDYHRFYHGVIRSVLADPDFGERLQKQARG